jgi:hypothetical protein
VVWAGHVEGMGEILTSLYTESYSEANLYRLRYQEVDRRIILNLILKKQGVRVWDGFKLT